MDGKQLRPIFVPDAIRVHLARPIRSSRPIPFPHPSHDVHTGRDPRARFGAVTFFPDLFRTLPVSKVQKNKSPASSIP